MFWDSKEIVGFIHILKRVTWALLIGLLIITVLPWHTTVMAQRSSHTAIRTQWPVIDSGLGYMRFEHLGVREGLSENTVLAILQDSQGFLWFGTREGLNKFDGHDFTVFKADPTSPNMLMDDYITSLIETADGDLWLGTYFSGIARFDRRKNTFEHFKPDPYDPSSLPDERVQAMLADSQGNLWIGTRGGLSLMVLESREIQNFRTIPGDPTSLSSDFVQAIFEDGHGRLWVGTDNGLNLLNPDQGNFSRFSFKLSSDQASVTSISSDGNDGLWVGTYGGLVRLDLQTFRHRVYRHEPDSIRSNQISVVYQDRSENLWIGFEDMGVNLVTLNENGRLTVVDFAHQEYDPNSLSHNRVQTIYQDQGGIMWFGTHGGGVNKANPATRAFGYKRHVPGEPNTLAGDNVTALAFDSARHSLWIGTDGAGLDRLDLATGEITHYRYDPQKPDSLPGDRVNLLHIGPQGNLYVGILGGGLKVFDPGVNGFFPALRGLGWVQAGLDVSAISHDPAGRLWVSQVSGELLRVDSAGGEIFRYNLVIDGPAYPQTVSIQDVHVDWAGIIWLATENLGLIRFDPEGDTYTVYEHDGTSAGPSHNSIISIYAGDDGMLWLGTAGGGLNRYDLEMEEFTYLTTRDGLPSNRVMGVLPDESGNLWVSTGNGLARYAPLAGEIHTFDIRDGLQGNTFNQHAYAAGDDGALFFGGVNGLNAFYPQNININTHAPPVVITMVSLFNEPLIQEIDDCSESVTLTHEQNFLSFEFAALDYTAPGNNRYAYIMEGLNDDYVHAGTRRHADYPNLAPGNYVFRLIGSNNDGVWNTDGVCLAIKIQPAFWGTWWFIGLLGMFLAASVVGGYRWRLHSIEQQRERLTVEVFERTQEIERRRQMASGLSDIVRLLNTNQPLEMSLDFIVKQSVGLTAASKAIVFERQGDQIIVKACYPAGETFKLDMNDPHSPSAQCLRESTFLNRLLIFSRINPETMQPDTRWELVSGDYHTSLCTPLVVGDVVYGGLVLYYGEERVFTPDEIRLAHTLADQASLAIANARLKDKAQETAVTEERNRLARDLHDAVTQTLFSTSLMAEVLPKIWKKDPQQAQIRLEELRQLTKGALGEMRTLLMALRPSALAEADPTELFKHLTDAFTGRTGVPVDYRVDISGDTDIPFEVKHVFYRVAQEGLNNIIKHAEATKVWFSFITNQEEVILQISDNGKGFDAKQIPPGHLGIDIMSERADAVSADLSITSKPGEGTHLRLVWRLADNTIK